MVKKLLLEPFYATCGKRTECKAAAKEINDVEGPGYVNEHVAQNWFRCFKEGDTGLEDLLLGKMRPCLKCLNNSQA